MSVLPDPKTLDAAFLVWHYHCLDEFIPENSKPFDLIVGLGSYDRRVAEKCAELYQDGLSKRIVFTGGSQTSPAKLFGQAEALEFKQVALKNGVLGDDIAIEEKAANTGENIEFVRDLFPKVESALFVSTPQMQRRCRATIDKKWPKLKRSIVTAPNVHLISQATRDIDLQKVIHEVVGNYWRIKTYPKRGFQTEQDFDEKAEGAFQQLVEDGYTRHLPENWRDELSA